MNGRRINGRLDRSRACAQNPLLGLPMDCDVLLSLERVWSCDVYRAGDGVHRAWLARRRRFELPLRQFARALNRKHRDLLHLEESLFASRKAGRVIVASQMVKKGSVD